MIYHNYCKMWLLETCLRRVCLIICVSSAFYMTYLQFKYYLNNEDLASISYQKFNNEEKDEYPTISICISGPAGWMFKPSNDDFKSTNATAASYSKYLRGLLKEYPAEFSDIKFDDIALDVRERFSIRYSGAFAGYHRRIRMSHSPLIPAYQDPSIVCISKNSSYEKGVKQILDQISLNSTMLHSVSARLKIYVHQKGRLIRNHLDLHVFQPEPNHYKAGIEKIIDIGQVDILRERDKSKAPCDHDIKDEDGYIINQSIANIGCIPTFWETFTNSVALHQTTRRCKSTNDYQNAQHQINDDFKTIGEKDSIYKKPCTAMLTSITTKDGQKKSRVIPGKLLVKFYYTQNLYREIVTSQAYTGETLLGQVGGFVGMPYQFILWSRIFQIILQ